MWDLLYIAIIVALVVVSAAFVIGLDKLIGPDDVALAEQGEDESDLEEAEELEEAA